MEKPHYLIVYKDGVLFDGDETMQFKTASDALVMAKSLACRNPADAVIVCKSCMVVKGHVIPDVSHTWTPMVGDIVRVLDMTGLCTDAIDKIKAGETAQVIAYSSNGALKIRFEDGMEQYINPNSVIIA